VLGQKHIDLLRNLNAMLCLFLCLTFGLGGQPYQLCIDSDSHVAIELTGSPCFLSEISGSANDAATAAEIGPLCLDVALAQDSTAEINLISVPAPVAARIVEFDPTRVPGQTFKTKKLKAVFVHLPDPLISERQLANLRI